MSHAELDEHRRYLADERKVAAYRAALAEVVGPDDVVLDLGAGTGLLGYLACDAGARSVVAVDGGDIVELARRIAADNGYAGRISHVQAMSTGFTLDPPADVAVCDLIGGLVHDAGILGCFADARARLLAPGATLVPASFRIFLAPVSFDLGRDGVDFWMTAPSGMDVSAAHELAVNTEWRYRLRADDAVTALAPGRELAAFASDHDGPITGCADFEVVRPGRFDGHIGWFEAQMSPSVTLTNDPWSAARFDRWCNFYASDEPQQLAAGDRIRLELDVRPRLGLVSWTTTCRRGDGTTATSRGSTFRGALLAGGTVAGADVERALPTGPRADALRSALDLVDGSRSQADLVRALDEMVGTAFASGDDVRRFVRGLAELIRG